MVMFVHLTTFDLVSLSYVQCLFKYIIVIILSYLGTLLSFLFHSKFYYHQNLLIIRIGVFQRRAPLESCPAPQRQKITSVVGEFGVGLQYTWSGARESKKPRLGASLQH